MSFWQDAAQFMIDFTPVGMIYDSEFYQKYVKDALGTVSPLINNLNKSLELMEKANQAIEQDEPDPNNPDTSVPDDNLSDIDAALKDALKQIETLEGLLANKNSKTYVQVMDVYKGDTGKMVELQNTIADMQTALSKAQIQHDQAVSRLSDYEAGLRAQSVGGQRKAMKQAAKTARDDIRTTNQNIYALTEGISKAESNIANIGKVEAMTPNEINDVIAMQVASQSGVPIAKTTTDPGKLVEISLPVSTTDVTLDEE